MASRINGRITAPHIAALMRAVRHGPLEAMASGIAMAVSNPGDVIESASDRIAWIAERTPERSRRPFVAP